MIKYLTFCAHTLGFQNLALISCCFIKLYAQVTVDVTSSTIDSVPGATTPHSALPTRLLLFHSLSFIHTCLSGFVINNVEMYLFSRYLCEFLRPLWPPPGQQGLWQTSGNMGFTIYTQQILQTQGCVTTPHVFCGEVERLAPPMRNSF